jgi:hypothetical protein
MADSASSMGQGRAVAASRGEGVVDIHDADDLCRERNLVAPKAIGISGAVVLLVVPADDRLDIPGKLDRREQVDTPDRGAA